MLVEVGFIGTTDSDFQLWLHNCFVAGSFTCDLSVDNLWWLLKWRKRKQLQQSSGTDKAKAC